MDDQTTEQGPIVDGVQRSTEWPRSMRYLMEFDRSGTIMVGGYESAKQAADHAEALGVAVLKIVLLDDYARAFVATQPKRGRHG